MPKFTRILAAIAALLTLGGGVGVAQAQAATPRTVHAAEVQHGYTLTAGPKLRAKSGFRTEFMGTLSLNGQLGDCFDYGKQAPNGHWTSGGLPEVSGATETQMEWLANTYFPGALKSSTTSAALKAALNRLASADFRYDWTHSYASQLNKVNKAVAPLADQMLTAAKTYAGPVSFTGSFTAEALPGGTGIVTVKATANGHAYPGQPVKFSLSGATVTSSSKTSTNSDGEATAHFTRTGVAAVSYRATMISPDWRKAGYSTPTSSGHQHLIRGGYTVSTSASGKYDTTFAATIAQDCTTTCNGKPPVTLTARASGAPVQWQAIFAGKTVAALNLAAGKSGSKTFTGQDAEVVSFRYRIKVGKKWSAYRTVKSFTVVCPPWPELTETKTCACEGGASVTATITIPTSVRFYTVTAGGESKDLTGGQSVTFTTALKSGDTWSVSFTAYADAAHTQQLSTGVLDAFTQES